MRWSSMMAAAVLACFAMATAASAMEEIGEWDARHSRERKEKVAFLGLATSPVSGALRRQVDLPRGVGLIVDSVEKGSPAEEAGIREFDVLHKLGDQLLINAEQFRVLIRLNKVGDEVKLTVIRRGKPETITVKLGEKEASPLEDRMPPFRREFPRDWFNRQFGQDDELRALRLFPDNGVMSMFSGRDRTEVIWSDPEYTLHLTSRDGQNKKLVVKDSSGKEIFNGPVDTEEQRKALSPEVAERLKKAEQSIEKAPRRATLRLTRPMTPLRKDKDQDMD